MRRAGVLIAVGVAASLAIGLGCGDLLAKSAPPAVASSMSARPDIVQLQSAAMDWLKATVTAPEFMYGAIVGVAIAETARFLLRGLALTWGLVAHVVGVFVHYRLMAVGAAAVAYYTASVYWGFGFRSLGAMFG